MVYATFNNEMRTLLRDIKGKVLVGVEYLPEKNDCDAAYGILRIHLENYNIDLVNEQKPFPFYDGVEDMSCFACHKTDKMASFKPFVISSQKSKFIGIHKMITRVEIMNDVIHINHDEYVISFDVALIIHTADHIYMFARDVWFSEIISIRDNDDYERVFSMRDLIESWNNEGESVVKIDRTRTAL